MIAVTLGLTDCRIMETKDSLARESDKQIAQGCLGIERNTFRHYRFHGGHGCDPAEEEGFTSTTPGGTLNMRCDARVCVRVCVCDDADEVGLNPAEAEARADDGTSAFHLPFIHYTCWFPRWKQRESVPTVEISGRNGRERKHGQEERDFFCMLTRLIRVSSRAAACWGLALTPANLELRGCLSSAFIRISSLICPYFSALRILCSPAAFFSWLFSICTV